MSVKRGSIDISKAMCIFFAPFENLIRPLEWPYQRIKSNDPIRLFLHFAKFVKGPLLAAAFFSTFSALVGLSLVWGLAYLVDGLTMNEPSLFIRDNWLPITLFLALMMIIDPIVYFCAKALLGQAIRVSLPAAVQWQGHNAVVNQDIRFFEDRYPGQVAARINQVAGSIQREFHLFADSLPRFIIQLVGSVALIGSLAAILAIPVIVWIAANSLLAWLALPHYQILAKKTAGASSALAGTMTDIYSNIHSVKLFASEASEASAVKSAIETNVETQHGLNRSSIAIDFSVHLTNIGLWVAMLLVGLFGISNGAVSIGDFVAGITIVRSLSANSQAFIGLSLSITQALGTIRDAMPVLTTEPEVVDAPNAAQLIVKQGRVSFVHVCFSYNPAVPIIVDFNLDIEPGEKVGIVGPSGAGKTTITRLLLRLYDVCDGAIKIDGQDIRNVSQSSLRAQVGLVTQDISLMHRSINANLKMGNPCASQMEVERAAKIAQADSFIAALRDDESREGYEAYVGDRGLKLSGGQRQRIALARAILKNAPIIILDEATSSLDSQTEKNLIADFDLFASGKTMICIAHRLSTLSRMDRIVVVNGGEIVEMGKPDDLIAANGLFARLWNNQVEGFLANG